MRGVRRSPLQARGSRKSTEGSLGGVDPDVRHRMASLHSRTTCRRRRHRRPGPIHPSSGSLAIATQAPETGSAERHEPIACASGGPEGGDGLHALLPGLHGRELRGGGLRTPATCVAPSSSLRALTVNCRATWRPSLVATPAETPAPPPPLRSVSARARRGVRDPPGAPGFPPGLRGTVASVVLWAAVSSALAVAAAAVRGSNGVPKVNHNVPIAKLAPDIRACMDRETGRPGGSIPTGGTARNHDPQPPGGSPQTPAEVRTRSAFAASPECMLSPAWRQRDGSLAQRKAQGRRC